MNILSLRTIKWWFGIAVILLPCWVGLGALTYLLSSPQISDCESDSWLQDSPAAIIYCATTIADAQDAKELHRAIALVDTIPKDHPLRREGDRLIEEWSKALLRLSEIAFQEGELDKAKDMAKQIPVHHPVHNLVVEQIKRWELIWSKAEIIYQSAEAQMKIDNPSSWYLALTKAKELKSLDNSYWASTRYRELVHNIQDIKEKDEENNKPQPKEEVTTIDELKVKQEVEDLAQLEKARKLAESGKLEEMKKALDEAYMVFSDAHYNTAQKFINDTRRKIAITEDRLTLEQAKVSAKKNDIPSLLTAVSQASMITNESAVYKEAHEKIAQWNQKIFQLEEIEDKNQARRYTVNAPSKSKIASTENNHNLTSDFDKPDQLQSIEQQAVKDTSQDKPTSNDSKVNNPDPESSKLSELENSFINQ
jgi:soluble cytochrome b562